MMRLARILFERCRGRFGRGAIFDVAIFGANCWLVPRITALAYESDATSVAYAVALLLSIILYSFGAALKKRPQAGRLESMDTEKHSTWAMIALFVLVIMQFGLYMISGSIALDAIKAAYPECGWIPEKESMVTMLIVLVAGAIPVFLTIRGLMPLRNAVEPSQALRAQERFADVALCFSSVVSLSIWDGLFMKALEGGGTHAWYMSILLVVLITIPFSIFYAAPRVLLLREDYRRPLTWVRIATVMLPLTSRLLSL